MKAKIFSFSFLKAINVRFGLMYCVWYRQIMIQNYSTASLIERFPCPAGVDNNCVNFDVSGALCEEIKDQKEAQKENCDLSEN